MKRLTVALLAAAISTPILAAEKPYVGIDYQLGTYTQNGIDIKPEAIRLRAGTELNKYLAVEAHAAAGTKSDVYSTDGGVTRIDITIDSFYSLFVRPQLSISDTLSIYGLVGGTYLDASASSSNKSISPDDSGYKRSFSYGVGFDFNVKNGVRLNADIIQYLDEYQGLSFGVRIPIR